MNWQAVCMEVTMVAVATVVLCLEIVGVKNKRILGMLALGGVVATAIIGILAIDAAWSGHQVPGALILAPMAIYLKYLGLLITFITLLISMDYVETQTSYPGEFYALILYIAAGIMLMAAANELITLFVSLELVSMPMYALAAYLKSNRRSSEAGLKYFLLGAIASAFYLYGASMVYALLGTTRIDLFLPSMSLGLANSPALVLGVLCILTAFGFKIGAAPFHMWIPDVYEGSPTPVTAYLSTGSKVAGLAVVLRVLLQGFNTAQPGVLLRHEWVLVVMVLSLLSMVVGNLVAIPQKNIKRMLGYSGIAHMGYILIGVTATGVAGTGSDGLSATLFYVFVYTMTNLAAWAIIILVSNVTRSEQIQDFAGLSKRAPILSLLLLLSMLSLAGVPPLAGFIGKFFLFTAAWQQHLYLLVVFGILASVVSLYYYLGVLRAAYFDAPTDPSPIPVSGGMKGALAITTLAIVVLGLVPAFTTWGVTTAQTFLTRL